MHLLDLWADFTEKESTQKLIAFFGKVGFVLKLLGKWAYRFRSLVLSIPVLICAAALALRNLRLLPEMVTVNLFAGEVIQIGRGVAAMFPLGVTVVCLVMMLCSRKILLPWLVSLLSLVLPLVIWLSNLFPV
jgi:hypothetical protein